MNLNRNITFPSLLERADKHNLEFNYRKVHRKSNNTNKTTYYFEKTVIEIIFVPKI